MKIWIKSFLSQNFLTVCIALAVVLALIAPGPGQYLNETGLSKALLVAIFLSQGITFQPSADFKLSRYVPVLLLGLAVNQAIGPWVGVATAHFAPLPRDYRVGLVLMSCMAPTLVSGAVLAVRAGGDAAAAMLLAVGINMIAVATVPLNLDLTLGADFTMDATSLLVKLVFLVLIPAVVGSVFARWQPDLAAPLMPAAKRIPVFALATIVYMAISKQAENLEALSAADLLVMVAASLFIHFVLMAAAWFGSVKALRMGHSIARSLTLVCSEKTLPLAVAVWTLAMAKDYPLAVLAPVVFHPSQILVDGFLANRWSNKRLVDG